MTGVSLATLTTLTLLSATPYSDAYKAALDSGRPLVVLVGAQWCPHCHTMKDNVVPQLKKNGTLERVIFAQVDADRQPGLARRLMSGSGVPQLVLYRKTDDGWRRRRLMGSHSTSTVKRFIEAALPAAQSPRVAPAASGD